MSVRERRNRARRALPGLSADFLCFRWKGPDSTLAR
jgi:hypothetical protein